jgi:phosphatidylserine/phosphatidylglycerophosphate/cardiolipin synthase-like enzyme
MHNKFFVFDQRAVWTGSTNLSDTELGGEYSTDVAALIESQALAQIYTAEFEEMFSGLFHENKSDNSNHVLDERQFTDGTELRSYFSPTDAATRNAIVPLIDAAGETLDVAMFFFTSEEIADALLRARARGVELRVILDAEGAGSEYSQHRTLCEAGVALKIENWGGKSHAKWVVADASSPASAAVVFGSMNFTRAGDNRNDENTLYVKNAALASEFAAEFEREWQDLATVPVCRPISAEGAESSSCTPSDDCTQSCASGACCDGIDNDHDGQLDRQEEACACSDGVDNDADGYVDSDDYDCVRRADAR